MGVSIPVAGQSVWIFGDTFFVDPAADGYHWRASTWSWTEDADASDGLDGWHHALGSDGKPLALLPHTAAEQAFDDAHNGEPCPAGSDCGARQTAWPAAAAVDPRTGSIFVFYQKENTNAAGFQSNGFSIAIWPSVDAPAIRPALRPELSDPTVMFPDPEPQLDAAALIDPEADMLYLYACPQHFLSHPCTAARAPVAGALLHESWTFYDGSGWTSDSGQSSSMFDGASIMSVHSSPYLGQYVAFSMGPLDGNMHLRTADRPEGPWSDDLDFGEGATPPNGIDYGLVAHPELAREGGKIEYLSYFEPGAFLDGTIHLLEITYP